jgi:hypothetical protein
MEVQLNGGISIHAFGIPAYCGSPIRTGSEQTFAINNGRHPF